jgi:hypothetical protein
MSFAVFLPLLFWLAIFFVPVWLLRRDSSGHAQDYLVSPRYTAPDAIRNSSIASSLRLAVFGPFFVLGASADFGPAIIGAVCFGLGISLVYVVGRPIFAFLANQMESDRSITVHAFIARQYGDDRRVRVAAAGLTLFALVAAVACEAFALFGFFKLVFGNDTVARAMAFAALLLAVLYAFPAGHPGVMYSGQLQLGAIFFGLIGAAALLLYQHVSALTPLPPYGSFAIGFAALCCLAVLIYRRSRYIETGPVGPSSHIAKLLSIFGKLLNPIISVFAVLVIVLAVMDFFAGRVPPPAPAAEPLQTGSSVPLMGWAALVLLPLFHPLANIVHWQRLAAIEKNREVYQGDTTRWLKTVRGILGVYAIEMPLLLLFTASLGAVTAAALASDGSAGILRALVQEAASGENPIATAAFSLLLVAVAAMALSSMASSFSAGLCSIRFDILPAKLRTSSNNRVARTFFLAIFLALIIAAETLPVGFTSSSFLALVFTLSCPILSFAPLIVSGIFSDRKPGAGWALLIMVSGVVCTAASLLGFITSGNDTWLWAGVPACVASGFFIAAAAQLSHGSRMR